MDMSRKRYVGFGFNLSDAVDESLCCQSDALEQLRRFWKKRHQNPLNKSWANFRQPVSSLTRSSRRRFFVAERKIGHQERKLSKNFFQYMAIRVKTNNRLKFIVKEGT